MLLLTERQEASSAVAVMTADSQLRLRDIEVFWDDLVTASLTSPKETGKRGSYFREFLNIVIGMLKCSSPQLMASGGVGKDSIFFKGMARV